MDQSDKKEIENTLGIKYTAKGWQRKSNGSKANNDIDANGILTTGESVEEYIRRTAKDDYGTDCLSATGQAIHLVGFADDEKLTPTERGGHSPAKKR